MPFYEYRCKKCGFLFEMLLRIDDRHKPCENPCPDCGAEKENIEFQIGAPQALMDTNKKVLPKGFKELMKKIKKQNGNGRNNIRDF